MAVVPEYLTNDNVRLFWVREVEGEYPILQFLLMKMNIIWIMTMGKPFREG